MFERFTTSARAVVVAARQEAGQFGHHYIGTEHLLLGLLTSQAVNPSQGAMASAPVGAAAKVLTASKISVDYVRSEVIRLVGTGDGSLGTHEADALQSIGIDLDVVRSKLEASFGEGVLDQPNGARAGSRLPLTPRAKSVLALSLREARKLRHDDLAPEHILLGLTREADGVAGQILSSKVALHALRDRLLAELDQAA